MNNIADYIRNVNNDISLRDMIYSLREHDIPRLWRGMAEVPELAALSALVAHGV